MKYLKKFNENIENEESLEAAEAPKQSTSSTPGAKIIKLDVFDMSAANVLRGQIRQGLKPYYMNKDHDIVEILVDDNGYPYESVTKTKPNRYGRPITSTRKNSLKGKDNPYGEVFLLTEKDVEDIQPLLTKVQDLLIKIEEQKGLLIKLVKSKLVHKKKDEQTEEL